MRSFSPKTATGQFLWLLRFKSLAFRRWLTSNLYTTIWLGGIILGGFWMMLTPYFEMLQKLLATHRQGYHFGDGLQIALSLTIFLVVFSFSATLQDVYATRTADSYLDGLGVTTQARFGMTVVARFLKNVPSLLIVVGLCSVLRPVPTMGLATLVELGPPLLAGWIYLTVLQVASVLFLVHVRWCTPRKLTGLLTGLLATTILVSWSKGFLVFLFPLLPAAGALESVLAGLLHPGSGGRFGYELGLPLGAGVLVLEFARRMFTRWRMDDRGIAQEFSETRRPLFNWVLDRFLRRLEAPVRAQIRRDIALCRRGFSPAVLMSPAFAILFQFGALSLIGRKLVSEDIFEWVFLLGVMFSAFSLIALAPLLLKYQLSYFWIEKSIGLSPEHLSESKLVLSRLFGLAAFGLACLAVVGYPTTNLIETGLVLLKAAVVCYTTASLVGILIFEVAARPLISLILCGVAASIIAGLFIFYWMGWPLWAYMYLYLMHNLRERVKTRVFFTEVEH
ncbi:MAG: hypothetical protein HY774_30005 [Acidobacteria bacterium]|nr:hypothetical protein [Acidobacteriota bacterium]